MLRALFVGCALLVAGCIEPDLLYCQSQVCPPGTTCQPSGVCVTSEQLAACAQLANYADCVVGTETGVCVEGACLVTACGNGIVDPGEVCDDGNRKSGDGCSYDCLSNETCGNGYIDFVVGEQCDDGNNIDGDGCEHDCQLPRCGNGILDPGEVCDYGIQGMPCSRDCLSDLSCGNGVLDPGEECDDGNNTDSDGCQHNCKLMRCGDGITDPDEQCDDGNEDNNDACLNTCKTAVCGDGVVETGVEECDDGNASDNDACTTLCKNARCGDGFTEIGVEQCDDGNADDNDCCNSQCIAATCGDGIAQTECKESCDDGMNNGTTCRDACRMNCYPGQQNILFFGPVEMYTGASVDVASGTVTLNGSFGGATYGDDVTDPANHNYVDFGVPGNDSVPNTTDSSQYTGLNVVSQTPWTWVTIGTGASLTTYASSQTTYCSNDGNGSVSPDVTLTFVDACGATVSYDTGDGGLSTSTSGWPICP